MAHTLKPVLVGGGWGLGLGIVFAATTVLVPTMQPLAKRALKGYRGAAGRAGRKVGGAVAARLQDIYAEASGASTSETRPKGQG